MNVKNIALNTIIFIFLAIPAVNAQSTVYIDDPFQIIKLPAEKSSFSKTQFNTKKQTPEEIIEVYYMPIISKAIALDSKEASLVNTTLVKYLRKSLTLDKAQIDTDSLKLYVQKLEDSQLEELKTILPKPKFDAFVTLRKDLYHR